MWLRDLKMVGKCNRNDMNWFNYYVSVKLGNGKIIEFWNHCWIGAQPLAVCFLNLFNAAVIQKSHVSHMGY